MILDIDHEFINFYVPNYFVIAFLTMSIEWAEHPWLHDSKKMPDVPLGDAVRARLQQFSAMNKLKKKALRVGFTTCW